MSYGPAQGIVAAAVSPSGFPLQAPTDVRTVDADPTLQLLLGGATMATDATAAAALLKGRNAYAQSTTDKAGSNLILAGGIGRRFVTIVDYSLIDSGVDTVTLTLGSVSTGSFVSTATVITAGTGWVPATSNAVTAGLLATHINTLGLSVTAVAVGDSCYITPDANLVSFTLATSMAAGEGTVTSGTDGNIPVSGFVVALKYSGAPAFAGGTSGNSGVSFPNTTQVDLYAASVLIATAHINQGFIVTQLGFPAGATVDAAFNRIAAANLRQGLAPSASPIAQTFTLGEASRPGTDTNIHGASGTIESGLGSGDGSAAGTLSGVTIRTPSRVASGSTTQTQAMRALFNEDNVSFATAAKATTDTTGWLMLPSCAGTPTGVPANIPTGQIAIVYDTTADKLWFYRAGWKQATAAGPLAITYV